MTRAVADGQLSIFDSIPAHPLVPGPCIFEGTGDQRGAVARQAMFDAWVARYGRFGSLGRSHALVTEMGVAAAERCQATVMHATIGLEDGVRPDGCQCPPEWSHLVYRAACRGCDWECPSVHHRENPAAEDGLDHAWPGWRDVPVVKSPPAEKVALEKWKATVVTVHPAGWLEAGGPIRTQRSSSVTSRHVPARTPWGGYDVGVPPVTVNLPSS